jgi:hypothetical protein
VCSNLELMQAVEGAYEWLCRVTLPIAHVLGNSQSTL